MPLSTLCAHSYFGIRVVDEVTKRGIPLVELRTVNGIRHITDNAGWIAFDEPGLMNRELCWFIEGPGIEAKKDGFGYRLLRTTATRGQEIDFPVKTTNIAERISRLTGQGLYHDSELLDKKHPLPNITAQGVVGQDSVQAAIYRDQQFWLWGDTSVARYPLGNFHTTCAWVDRHADPEKGINFRYLTDPKQPENLRKMMPSTEPGTLWLFGLLTLQDDKNERMFAGYSRQQQLGKPLEKGMAEFDAEKGIFHSVATVSPSDPWHYPHGHAVSHEGYYYFCGPFAHTRVKADASALIDAHQYETYVFDRSRKQWSWQRDCEPSSQSQENSWLRSGEMKPEQTRYQLHDSTGAAVALHGASIQWNAWRKKWILIGVEFGGKNTPSILGEVWYAESEQITGPWGLAIKVASHPNYSYYNPVHHGFLDREGGKIIYFEGTYTREFSGNPLATPRYDYNQLMYRLDLSDPRLKLAP